jgi:hypothetical protein
MVFPVFHEDATLQVLLDVAMSPPLQFGYIDLQALEEGTVMIPQVFNNCGCKSAEEEYEYINN